ncbi:MAG: hypothetical protein KDI55_14475 [Anaerolineae bacterium]|nr:hypothetical protein [Anaerolineae bacterium]
MRHVKGTHYVVALLLIALFLSACQPQAEPANTAPPPADTATVAPTDTAPPPADTATVAPTDTALPPADTAASEEEIAGAQETDVTLEEMIANAMSAGPAPIAENATILGYPEEGRGNWPDEPAPELVELRAGDNGWTCIVDIPDTPGNDPMCLNDTYLEVFLSSLALTDAPDTGVGFGYMLQGGGPVGSPPHMMVFAPQSNASFNAFGTEPGPMPWIMYPETSQQHLMVLTY